MPRQYVPLSVLLGLVLLASPVASKPRPLTLLSYDYPPFMVAAGHSPAGLVVDIVEEVFHRMGTPVNLQFYPLARSYALMEAGQADGMFTLKRTPEREIKYLFPREALLLQQYVLFTNLDSTLDFSGDLNTLSNVSIGMLGKTSYGPNFDDAVNRGLFKKLEIAANHEANFRKLLAHRMDAVISGRQVGLALIERLGATAQVKVVGPPIDTALSYLMFNRKTVAPGVVAQFDKELAGMRKDGSLRKIELKYDLN